MQVVKKLTRKLKETRSQSGFTLIEAVIGIALLSLVVVAVLMGVSTAFKTDVLADSQSTALSIAQRQIEDLQLQLYQVAPNNGEATYAKVAAGIPAGYSIWSYNRAGNLVSVDINNIEGVIGVPWSSTAVEVGQPITPGSSTADDLGLQRIKLVIKQGNKTIIEVETYKVK